MRVASLSSTFFRVRARQPPFGNGVTGYFSGMVPSSALRSADTTPAGEDSGEGGVQRPAIHTRLAAGDDFPNSHGFTTSLFRSSRERLVSPFAYPSTNHSHFPA